jgi:hypothetical protein
MDRSSKLDQLGSRVGTHRRAPFRVLRYYENRIIEMQLLNEDVPTEAYRGSRNASAAFLRMRAGMTLPRLK